MKNALINILFALVVFPLLGIFMLLPFINVVVFGKLFNYL